VSVLSTVLGSGAGITVTVVVLETGVVAGFLEQDVFSNIAAGIIKSSLNFIRLI
jgi:hypothetical protein